MAHCAPRGAAEWNARDPARAASPQLKWLGSEERWFRIGALATGYGNVIAGTIGAAFGARGLAPGGPLANWTVFALFSVAIVGVFLALALAIRGALRAQSGAR